LHNVPELPVSCAIVGLHPIAQIARRTGHAYRITTALEETEMRVRVDNREPMSYSRTIRQKNDHEYHSFSSILSAIATTSLGAGRANVNA